MASHATLLAVEIQVLRTSFPLTINVTQEPGSEDDADGVMTRPVATSRYLRMAAMVKEVVDTDTSRSVVN